MIDYKEIALKIKKYRKKLNLTQKEFGEKIGKTESSIRKYEKGLTQIPNDVLQKIAEVFNISIFELLDTENKNITLNLKDIYRETIKKMEIDNLDSKNDKEKIYSELIPLTKEFLGDSSDELLKEVIKNKLIINELEQNLKKYFRSQNHNYTNEELNQLIEKAFIILEVLSKIKDI